MPSKHAEIDAINKIKKKKNLPKQVDIVVIKLTKSGQLGESRPCYHCLCSLERSNLNIKHVYYSTKNNTIIREKLADMKYCEHTQISSGMRHAMKNKINRN